MLILGLFLFFIGGAAALIGGVWMLVLAFQREWREVKSPALLFLGGGILTVIGALAMPHTLIAQIESATSNRQSPLAALAEQLKPKTLARKETSPTPSDARNFVDHSMFGAQQRAELQIRLISLRQKEANLQERKAELDPNDQPGAAKLAEEINRYNAELKPVAEAIQAHPDWKLE